MTLCCSINSGTHELAISLCLNHPRTVFSDAGISGVKKSGERLKSYLGISGSKNYWFPRQLSRCHFQCSWVAMVENGSPEMNAYTLYERVMVPSLKDPSNRHLYEMMSYWVVYCRDCQVTSPSIHAQSDYEAEKLWRWSCSKTSLPLNL